MVAVNTFYAPSFGKLALDPSINNDPTDNTALQKEERQFLIENSSIFKPDNHSFSRFKMSTIDQWEQYRLIQSDTVMGLVEKALEKGNHQEVIIVEVPNSNILADNMNKLETIGMLKEVKPGIFQGNLQDYFKKLGMDGEDLGIVDDDNDDLFSKIDFKMEFSVSPTNYTKEYKVIDISIGDITEKQRNMLKKYLALAKTTQLKQVPLNSQ